MRTPSICMVVMCALDIVFNALFIFPTGTVRLGSLALPGARLGTAGAALGTRVLRIKAFAEPMYGASIVAGGVFQGAGSTLIPTLFNLGTLWGIQYRWRGCPRPARDCPAYGRPCAWSCASVAYSI